ncbi:DUF3429 domain-containing protein [Flavisphingomonas formosensis]|uniref:DUF3429 domain-containing protein n=1 Tax=Flavisphingomonas formosensis TaxID=861534 RepID=UPI0012FB9E56|nr:DUF3429 domain-containing protein [Sphingomonas formosensis]
MRSRDPDSQVDPVATPSLSFLLGFGSMAPIVCAGIGALGWHDPLRAVAIVGGTTWASAVLIFIAGVRRGYGFARTAQPSWLTLAGTILMFLSGFLAMPIFLLSALAGVALLMLGYAASALLDPVAAIGGEAPRHFVRLRPLQMIVGLIGLGLIEIAIFHAV